MERELETRPLDKDLGTSCRRMNLTSLTEGELAPRILEKRRIADKIVLLNINAPLIAAAAQPGQFILIRPNEAGERIPLTISDWEPDCGTITIIFQEVGRSTRELGSLEIGDVILDLAGPLGKPSEIENYGSVVCVGGGVGIAVLRPIAKALKSAGNEVTGIIGARDAGMLILEEDMREISDHFYITTDNGSLGRKGFVSDVLKEILDIGKPVNLIFAIGPLPMMKVISDLTRPYGVRLMVSLDPIMIDGTGMCGGCRVTVGGETRLTCVDGPDFDGHLVDWEELKLRKQYYCTEESCACEGMQEEAS